MIEQVPTCSYLHSLVPPLLHHPTELFQPRPPHFPVMGTKCLACSRIPTRCVWRNLSPQANEVWRYDHKSLWKPFTQPALLVQQFKHHNMRSAVLPSMSLANLPTNPFWGYPFNIWLGWSAIALHKMNYSKNILDLFTTMGQILCDSMFLTIFSYRLRLLYIMAVFFNSSFQLCPRTKTGYHTWSV